MVNLSRGKPLHKLGYRPTPSSHRLARLSPLSRGVVGPVPDLDTHLLQFFPGIRNQEQEGCCTGFASAGFRETLHGSCAGKVMTDRLSPAYLYARTRMAEGSFPRDSGATMADEFGVLEGYGVCPEQDLPYDADPTEAPTPVCDAAAVQFRIGEPLIVPMDRDSICRNIVSGQPIGIAFPVYESFEQVGSDGKLTIPNRQTEAMMGGHGVLILAYDAFGMTGANQWDVTWGDKGFFHMPWGYENLWWEAWTAQPVL